MLYNLTASSKSFDGLEPMPFEDFSHSGNLHKDLEHLIAENILHVLFEDAPLIPVFQVRLMQKEADIYALNESGDLIIFELKCGLRGEKSGTRRTLIVATQHQMKKS